MAQRNRYFWLKTLMVAMLALLIVDMLALTCVLGPLAASQEKRAETSAFCCAPDPKRLGPGPYPPHPRSWEALGYPHTTAHGDPVADPFGDPRATTPGDTRAGGKCHSDPGERVRGWPCTGIKWRRRSSAIIAPGDSRQTCRDSPPNLVVTTGSRACGLNQSDPVAVGGCPFSEHAGYGPGIDSRNRTYRHAYSGRDAAYRDPGRAFWHTEPDQVTGHRPAASARSARG